MRVGRRTGPAGGARIAAALLLAAVGLSACADDAPAPRAATAVAPQDLITEVIVENQTQVGDAETECATTVTPAFAEMLFGGVDRCRAWADAGGGGEVPPDEVTVSDVTVAGSTASASVELVGGPLDGVTGGLSLVEEGGVWRIDDFDAAFAQSSMRAALGNVPLPARGVACVLSVAGPHLRSGAASKELYIALVRREREATDLLTLFGTMCSPIEVGAAGTPGRNEFERVVFATLTAAGSASELRAHCALGRLREQMPEIEVESWQDARAAGGTAPPLVRDRIQWALDLCADVP